MTVRIPLDNSELKGMIRPIAETLKTLVLIDPTQDTQKAIVAQLELLALTFQRLREHDRYESTAWSELKLSLLIRQAYQCLEKPTGYISRPALSNLIQLHPHWRDLVNRHCLVLVESHLPPRPVLVPSA